MEDEEGELQDWRETGFKRQHRLRRLGLWLLLLLLGKSKERLALLVVAFLALFALPLAWKWLGKKDETGYFTNVMHVEDALKRAALLRGERDRDELEKRLLLKNMPPAAPAGQSSVALIPKEDLESISRRVFSSSGFGKAKIIAGSESFEASAPAVLLGQRASAGIEKSLGSASGADSRLSRTLLAFGSATGGASVKAVVSSGGEAGGMGERMDVAALLEMDSGEEGAGSVDIMEGLNPSDILDTSKRSPLPPDFAEEDPGFGGLIGLWMKEGQVWKQIRVTEKVSEGAVKLDSAEKRTTGTRATYFKEYIPAEAARMGQESRQDAGLALSLSEAGEPLKEDLMKKRQEVMKQVCASNRAVCQNKNDRLSAEACAQLAKDGCQ